MRIYATWGTPLHLYLVSEELMVYLYYFWWDWRALLLKWFSSFQALWVMVVVDQENFRHAQSTHVSELIVESICFHFALKDIISLVALVELVGAQWFIEVEAVIGVEAVVLALVVKQSIFWVAQLFQAPWVVILWEEVFFPKLSSSFPHTKPFSS